MPEIDDIEPWLTPRITARGQLVVECRPRLLVDHLWRTYQYIEQRYGRAILPRWYELFSQQEMKSIWMSWSRKYWTDSKLRRIITKIMQEKSLVTMVKGTGGDRYPRFTLTPGLTRKQVSWLCRHHPPTQRRIMAAVVEFIREDGDVADLEITVGGRVLYMTRTQEQQPWSRGGAK